MPQSQEDKIREGFIYWWPVVARVAGIIGAFAEAGFAIVTRQSADAGFLAFCGSLILAPTIFDQQGKRNRRRELSHGEEDADGIPEDR